MSDIVATFFYKGTAFLIDRDGQVWTQDDDNTFAKIGDIDLDAEITEENTRA